MSFYCVQIGYGKATLVWIWKVFVLKKLKSQLVEIDSEENFFLDSIQFWVKLQKNLNIPGKLAAFYDLESFAACLDVKLVLIGIELVLVNIRIFLHEHEKASWNRLAAHFLLQF